ncbi:MAG: NADH:ubiquinone reductase (Na(+)-transporting) subunit C [Planctomycetota bacterium]
MADKATPAHGTLYTVLFAAGVCLVCSVLVTGVRVALRERQLANAALDRQRNVLRAAGLAEPGEALDAATVAKRFERVEALVYDTGAQRLLPETDAAVVAREGAPMRPVPVNDAGVREIPERLVIYRVQGEAGTLWVLPVWGKGLWSTMRAYLALDGEGDTIRGVAFYEQQETPGLGGEVENPEWTATWEGVEAYGPDGEPAVAVVKPKKRDPGNPHQIDALSGATMTSRGVEQLVNFWLGELGYGPWLKRDGSQEDGG